MINFIMDSMDRGLIYIDSDRKIRMCNKIAESITGIHTDPPNIDQSAKTTESITSIHIDPPNAGQSAKSTEAIVGIHTDPPSTGQSPKFTKAITDIHASLPNTDQSVKSAEAITGIYTGPPNAFQSGKIAPNDIVAIADNKLGDDDGNLTADDLSALNIYDRRILPGGMFVAIGLYRNEKAQPEYKYTKDHQFGVPFKINTNYFGFHISASIDTAKKETAITVNEDTYKLPYFSSIGHIVVIDQRSGKVKFFQSRGYSTRHEEIGALLRGGSFKARKNHGVPVDVTGKYFLDFFDQSEFTDRIFAILDGTAPPIKGQIHEINKRPFVCTVAPWQNQGAPEGVFLIFRSVEDWERLFSDRNEIIRQIEEQYGSAGTGQRERGFPPDAFEGFVGSSTEITKAKYLAYKASQNRFNVLITGESGTGKSKLAREIHDLWDKSAPFIEVNCNAIPATLIESELFGYVGGAFTGARNDGKVGFFEAASGGTIFLDEIGELPVDMQIKLLHVLQDKRIYRVGSSVPVDIDVRVITATNKDLGREVVSGGFRQDLYYRINVFPIELPPLRERAPDMYPLISRILENICKSYHLGAKQLSGDAIHKLLSYKWPGNVRELENVLERAAMLCESNIIYTEYLGLGEEPAPLSLKELLAEEERKILENAIARHNGDKHKAMETLRLSKTVFYDKLKKYGIH